MSEPYEKITSLWSKLDPEVEISLLYSMHHSGFQDTRFAGLNKGRQTNQVPGYLKIKETNQLL
jgi:hypothetical protein